MDAINLATFFFWLFQFWMLLSFQQKSFSLIWLVLFDADVALTPDMRREGRNCLFEIRHEWLEKNCLFETNLKEEEILLLKWDKWLKIKIFFLKWDNGASETKTKTWRNYLSEMSDTWVPQKQNDLAVWMPQTREDYCFQGK